MSRWTELLREVERKDARLAADLAREYKVLSERRAFGLNFERHVPETVELPGRPIRRGDKVRFLPARGVSGGSVDDSDSGAWHRSSRTDRRPRLPGSSGRARSEVEPETATRPSTISSSSPSSATRSTRASSRRARSSAAATSRSTRSSTPRTSTRSRRCSSRTRARSTAIYIDPPYNTGAKDWKYNNDYVDADDLYRHSKWLAFMERRLLLAKQLLNPADSVLIVTIDENEVHRLRLLLEQTFP